MIKRYWVFGGTSYYPNGGLDDLSGKFDTLEEALANIKIDGHLYDLDEQGVVTSGGFIDWASWAYIYDLTEDRIVKGLRPDEVGALKIRFDYLLCNGEEQYLKIYEMTDYIKKRVKERLDIRVEKVLSKVLR